MGTITLRAAGDRASRKLPTIAELPGALYLFYFLSCAWILAVLPALVLAFTEDDEPVLAPDDPLYVEAVFLFASVAYLVQFWRRDITAFAIAIPALLCTGTYFCWFASRGVALNVVALVVGLVRLAWVVYLIRARRTVTGSWLVESANAVPADSR